MFRQLRKTLVATLIAALTVGQVMPAFADSSDNLPDMGTSAGSTLSIGQEMQMGDYYVRQLRGSAPLINDPLLVQYINGLGMRLVAHANSVKTPFHFYLINNDEINAFAFFGGNVVLHSALFRYSDNESQQSHNGDGSAYRYEQSELLDLQAVLYSPHRISQFPAYLLLFLPIQR